MNKFVCFIKQARLLAIVSIFGGGVDSSVLWLTKTGLWDFDIA
jgi:hypothetical protein